MWSNDGVRGGKWRRVQGDTAEGAGFKQPTISVNKKKNAGGGLP